MNQSFKKKSIQISSNQKKLLEWHTHKILQNSFSQIWAKHTVKFFHTECHPIMISGAAQELNLINLSESHRLMLGSKTYIKLINYCNTGRVSTEKVK